MLSSPETPIQEPKSISELLVNRPGRGQFTQKATKKTNVNHHKVTADMLRFYDAMVIDHNTNIGIKLSYKTEDFLEFVPTLQRLIASQIPIFAVWVLVDNSTTYKRTF